MIKKRFSKVMSITMLLAVSMQVSYPVVSKAPSVIAAEIENSQEQVIYTKEDFLKNKNGKFFENTINAEGKTLEYSIKFKDFTNSSAYAIINEKNIEITADEFSGQTVEGTTTNDIYYQVDSSKLSKAILEDLTITSVSKQNQETAEKVEESEQETTETSTDKSTAKKATKNSDSSDSQETESTSSEEATSEETEEDDGGRFNLFSKADTSTKGLDNDTAASFNSNSGDQVENAEKVIDESPNVEDPSSIQSGGRSDKDEDALVANDAVVISRNSGFDFCASQNQLDGSSEITLNDQPTISSTPTGDDIHDADNVLEVECWMDGYGENTPKVFDAVYEAPDLTTNEGKQELKELMNVQGRTKDGQYIELEDIELTSYDSKYDTDRAIWQGVVEDGNTASTNGEIDSNFNDADSSEELTPLGKSATPGFVNIYNLTFTSPNGQQVTSTLTVVDPFYDATEDGLGRTNYKPATTNHYFGNVWGAYKAYNATLDMVLDVEYDQTTVDNDPSGADITDEATIKYNPSGSTDALQSEGENSYFQSIYGNDVVNEIPGYELYIDRGSEYEADVFMDANFLSRYFKGFELTAGQGADNEAHIDLDNPDCVDLEGNTPETCVIDEVNYGYSGKQEDISEDQKTFEYYETDVDYDTSGSADAGTDGDGGIEQGNSVCMAEWQTISSGSSELHDFGTITAPNYKYYHTRSATYSTIPVDASKCSASTTSTSKVSTGIRTDNHDAINGDTNKLGKGWVSSSTNTVTTTEVSFGSALSTDSSNPDYYWADDADSSARVASVTPEKPDTTYLCPPGSPSRECGHRYTGGTDAGYGNGGDNTLADPLSPIYGNRKNANYVKMIAGNMPGSQTADLNSSQAGASGSRAKNQNEAQLVGSKGVSGIDSIRIGNNANYTDHQFDQAHAYDHQVYIIDDGGYDNDIPGLYNVILGTTTDASWGTNVTSKEKGINNIGQQDVYMILPVYVIEPVRIAADDTEIWESVAPTTEEALKQMMDVEALRLTSVFEDDATEYNEEHLCTDEDAPYSPDEDQNCKYPIEQQHYVNDFYKQVKIVNHSEYNFSNPDAGEYLFTFYVDRGPENGLDEGDFQRDAVLYVKHDWEDINNADLRGTTPAAVNLATITGDKPYDTWANVLEEIKLALVATENGHTIGGTQDIELGSVQIIEDGGYHHDKALGSVIVLEVTYKGLGIEGLFEVQNTWDGLPWEASDEITMSAINPLTVPAGDDFNPLITTNVKALNKELKEQKVMVDFDIVSPTLPGSYQVGLIGYKLIQGSYYAQSYILIDVNVVEVDEQDRVQLAVTDSKTRQNFSPRTDEEFMPLADAQARNIAGDDISDQIQVFDRDGFELSDDTTVGDPYEITYGVTDDITGITYTDTADYTVIGDDEYLPDVTLKGTQPVYVKTGDDVDESTLLSLMGAQIELIRNYEFFGMDDSNMYIVTSDGYDPNQTGTYYVEVGGIYDESKSEIDPMDAEAIFEVIVDPTVETTQAQVELDGISDMQLAVGSTFDPLEGVTATSKTDGDITDQIQILGNTVDTSTDGNYEVTYYVEDSTGSYAQIEREVQVGEGDPKTEEDEEDITDENGTDENNTNSTDENSVDSSNNSDENNITTEGLTNTAKSCNPLKVIIVLISLALALIAFNIKHSN